MRPVVPPSRQLQLLSVPGSSDGVPDELLLPAPLETIGTHTLSVVHVSLPVQGASGEQVLTTVWTLYIAGSASGGILPAQFTTPTHKDRS